MRNALFRAILRIVLSYVLFAGVWIFASNWALRLVVSDPALRMQWSTYSGSAFVVVTGLILCVLLRIEFLKFERDRFFLCEREEELRRNQTLLLAVIEGTSDAVYVKDPQGRYLLFNSSTCRYVGKSGQEILGKDDRALFSAADAGSIIGGDQRVLASGVPQTYEEFITIKGEVHTFLSTKGPVRDSNGNVIGLFGIARDITELQCSAKELRRLNRALRTICNCNQALVHATNEAELLDTLCHIVVERGGYRMVWVGFAEEDESKTVRPVAQAGFEEGYLNTVNLTWAENERGRGPVGTAIRTGQPCVIRDVLTDAVFTPWRSESLRRGYASVASIPLRVHGKAFGALNIYAAAPGAFDAEEMGLLTELAEDLAYGITALRTREAHEHAEAARHESEKRLRFALEGTNDGLWDVQLGTGEFYMSPRGCEILGFGTNELPKVARVWNELVHPDDIGSTLDRLKAHLEGRAPLFEVEQRLRTKSGGWKWILTRGKEVARDEQGKALRITGTHTDISARKQAEAALRESEKKYRELVEHANSIILRWNCGGRITFLNEFGQRFFGYSANEIIGRHVVGTIVPPVESGGRDLRELMDEICANPKAFEQNVNENTLRNGEHVWIAWANRVVLDEQGKLKEVLSIGSDITARKKAEEALLEGTRQLQLALHAAHMGVWQVNLRTNVITTIHSGGPISGLPEELAPETSEDFLALLHPDDRSQVSERLRRASEMGEAYQAEFRIVLPDHNIRWVSAHGRCTLDAAGHPSVLVGVDLDITERKQAETERDRLFNLSLDMLCITKLDGFFKQVNPAWSNTLGWSEAELLQRSWVDIVHPEDREETVKKLEELRAGRSVLGFENRWRCKDGAYRWISWTTFPLAAEGVAFAAARDINERKMAEDEVRRLHKDLQHYAAELEHRVRQRTAQLELSNQELEAFSYSVSHDLRAPLRSIDGWSLALLEDCGEQLDANGRKYLDRVRCETRRLGQLIDDLLQLARVTRVDMQTVPIDLTSVVQTIAMRIRAVQADRQIDFLIQPGVLAKGDSKLLEVVLTNLLENASKFTSKCAQARIEFGSFNPSPDSKGEHAPVYYVRDNGAGFDMANAQKLFGAFQRMHKSSEFPGTGIGLATVQRIILRHGGRVWAEAQVDKGATFFFTLSTSGGE